MPEQPEEYHIRSTYYSPNNRLPVLVYRDVLPKPYDESTTTEFLTKNGWERRVSRSACL